MFWTIVGAIVVAAAIIGAAVLLFAIAVDKIQEHGAGNFFGMLICVVFALIFLVFMAVSALAQLSDPRITHQEEVDIIKQPDPCYHERISGKPCKEPKVLLPPKRVIRIRPDGTEIEPLDKPTGSDMLWGEPARQGVTIVPKNSAVVTIWEIGQPPLVPKPVQTVPIVPALPVVAAPPPPSPRKYVGQTLPPEQYDHHFEGMLTLRMVDNTEDMRVLCKQPIGTSQLGCAYRRNNGEVCDIYLMNDAFMLKYGLNTAALLRHEIAHCNGWPNDHPGAIAVSRIK